MTRHNIGFMAVDGVNDRFQGSFKKAKGPYLLSDVSIQRSKVLLVKPLTYMNLSGQAAAHLVSYYKAEDLSKMLIVSDDFNLPFGTIRLRPSGSAGGQKGLLSIFEALQTNAIARLRIGIGSEFTAAKSYVLSPFNRSELKVLPEIINGSADAIESFVVNGITNTMNLYNRNLLSD